MTYNSGKLEGIADLLVGWYEKNGRKYPWRESCAPYELLIAEIMLQRTKADQVAPVYLSFIEKFPDVASLSRASSDDLLGFFSKLGLIRRAKQVQDLAKELIERFHGEIPRNRDELLSLPSVGDYIADALLCFAFGQHVAVVDANVCRIIKRLFNVEAKGEARRDKKFKNLAEKMLPFNDIREYNWGMIDLGAKICKSRKPLCLNCPLASFCKYHSHMNRETRAQSVHKPATNF